MAKAALTLPNGTAVQIEGTVQEVQALLVYYGSGAVPPASATPEKATTARDRRGPKAVPKAQPSIEGKSGGTRRT